jgi:hypothetical protein
MKLDKEECRDRFELYEKKVVDKRGGVTKHLLSGARGAKGMIHIETSEFSTFDDKPTKIPRGYKKVTQKRRNQYVNDWACKTKQTKKLKQRTATKLAGALPWEKWYQKSRKYWMTFKEFKAMKKGDKVIVLSLHNNVLDGPLTYFKENVAYRPEKFFKSEKDTVIYNGDMEIISSKVVKNKQPIKLDVEYKKGSWLPIEKEKYPGNPNVGYWGPYILWSDLQKLPKLYYK